MLTILFYHCWSEQNGRFDDLFAQIDDIFKGLNDIKQEFHLETKDPAQSYDWELSFGKPLNSPHHVLLS